MAENNPLEAIFQDIERAIEARFYYHAIVVCLSMPDICAALLCDPSSIWVTEKKYVEWCEANLEKRFKFLTAKDCYRLRCGVLHQGNFGHPKARYDRIVFTLPSKIQFPEGRIGSPEAGELVLLLNCVIFCERMVSAARDWLSANTQDKNVQANLQNIVRFRPAGISLPPTLQLKGVPVIA